MILRVLFFALMALGLTGFGAVAWLSARTPTAEAAAAAAAPQARKTILVTARPIQAGVLLKAEDLASKELSVDEIGAAGLDDTPETRSQLIGAMVRRSLAGGDLVRSDAIVKPGEHGFLAAVLGPGMRAVTIGVDATSGSAGLIWPGDRVDLILTQSLGDGTNSTVPLGRRVAAETVARNTRVIAIDQQMVQGSSLVGHDSNSRTVTLEVSPDQAERLAVASRLGRLSLALRSAGEAATEDSLPSRPVWARDVSPALGGEAAPPVENVIRIHQGGSPPKEFKF